MSWDVFICDFPKDAKTISDIPRNWEPPAIGTRSQVIAKIKEAAPRAKFSDSNWGSIETASYSIEICLDTNDVQKCVVLFVHGSEDALTAVTSIISSLGLRAVDSGSGDFFVPGPKGVEGFRKWAAYRDQVVSKYGSSRKSFSIADSGSLVLAAALILPVAAVLWRIWRRPVANVAVKE